ncbi:hypothetical protein Ddye_023971 [Dipteronia dyeriana]|uniref:RNase H type-1 domain-containing protein n=1 Tax=Dipteronia dyeriana TaxID=168575 RepID=A0AAD9TUJ3_9ROSI|nr:hypothetical protein Ddye_023971 [Dipteronia dyeriana]
MGKYPNYLLFAVTLWFIWKWRCESVFNANFKLPNCTGKIVLKFLEDWWKANNEMDKKVEMRNCFLAWYPPAQDWIKLIVDVSMRHDSESIAGGGVLRGHKKSWLGGFALNKGTSNMVEAVLWGILEGLKLAWKAGYRKVMVES